MFTPGPWEAYGSNSAGWSVRKQDPRPGRDTRDPICSMAWFQFDIPGVIDNEISIANARLIAAAPDLLEACHKARALLAGSIAEADQHLVEAALRDAIAKATREEAK